MIVCPFCHFSNEDGALFCEQCKSDLSGVSSPVPVEPIAVEAVAVEAVAVEAVAVEPVPVVPVEEDDPIPVVPVLAEPMPVEPVPVVPETLEVPAQASAAAAPAPPPAPAPAPPAPAAVAPAPVGGDGYDIPQGKEPRLLVLRGQKRNVEFPIFEGNNFIGRADEKPVDIDLEDQEPPDRVWCSRQHALITFENGRMSLEDLNSSNGTYLNRNRVYPGQKQDLKVGDIIQIGNVQLKLVV